MSAPTGGDGMLPALPAWLAPGAPLPEGVGTFHEWRLGDADARGWREIVCEAGCGPAGLRVIAVLTDADTRLRAVTDTVLLRGVDATAGRDGDRVETLLVKLEPDGKVHGTRWRMVNGAHVPAALSEQEQAELQRLAADLLRQFQS